jgi:hypothetical protein
MAHYQVRLVKRIGNDGTIYTFSELGKMYESDDQKTLKKGCSLEAAVSIAKNMNSDLPAEVKGMVITRFKKGRNIILVKRTDGEVIIPFLKDRPRTPGTTEWLRFISRDNKVFEISQNSHRITKKCNNLSSPHP